MSRRFPRILHTRLDGKWMRRGLLRKHATGELDRECRESNRSYVCRGCGARCCWCFGAADDMPAHCDDCWAAAQAPKNLAGA